ncbi:hypothetical protein PoB_006781600 [Plakobranchus ocellatus]|uniref:Uncharacterized protein n=1 Tax=Plakobranchus ocellatus TaxID=259542 RepID=A0AAV4DBK4_9GAST|nr:hypothetical protein PoB_006781600 [Plakobranchus ocellatus]
MPPLLRPFRLSVDPTLQQHHLYECRIAASGFCILIHRTNPENQPSFPSAPALQALQTRHSPFSKLFSAAMANRSRPAANSDSSRSLDVATSGSCPMSPPGTSFHPCAQPP